MKKLKLLKSIIAGVLSLGAVAGISTSVSMKDLFVKQSEAAIVKGQTVYIRNDGGSSGGWLTANAKLKLNCEDTGGTWHNSILSTVVPIANSDSYIFQFTLPSEWNTPKNFQILRMDSSGKTQWNYSNTISVTGSTHNLFALDSAVGDNSHFGETSASISKITLSQTTGGTISMNVNEATTNVPTGSYVYSDHWFQLKATPKDGYDFTKWKANGSDFSSSGTDNPVRLEGIAADTTFSAVFTPKKYNVMFINPSDAEGGDTSVNATFGSAMPSITLPTRTGYTFEGYFDAQTGGNKYYNADGTSARNWDKASAGILYAQWSAASYSVTLDPKGGTGGSASVTATYGSAMPSATMPTKTGYTFDGYFDAETGGTQYYTSSGLSAKNWDKASATTLYAQWSVASYTVTLNAKGGSGGSASVTATYGSAMPSATMPTKTGYTFIGYFDAETGGTKYYTSTGESAKNWDKTSDTTLYAQWTGNGITVTLDAGEGKVKDSNTFNIDTVVGNNYYSESLPAATRTGYSFKGWYTAADGGDEITFDTTVTNPTNHTLYAHWEARTYTVTLNFEGGAGGTADIIATYDFDMPTATMPTRTGYTFNGYYDAQNGGTQYYKADGTSAKKWDKAQSSAINLYAQWTANKYDVVFSPNGGVASDLLGTNVTFGSAMPELTSFPSKEGYVFAGYFDSTTGGTKYYNADGTSAHIWDKAVNNSVIYAHWTESAGTKYTVIHNFENFEGGWDAHSETLSGTTDQSTNAVAQVLEGFTAQSFNQETIKGDGTTVVIIYYKRNTHSIQWTTSGDTLTGDYTSGTNIKYGTQITAPNEPTKTGYTFAGWTPSVPSNMPDENLEFEATWTANKYDVVFSPNGGVASDQLGTKATFGSAMPKLTSFPSKEGYVFAGYFDSTTGGTKYYNADGTSAHIWDKAINNSIIYAHWTVGTYNITFNTNGGSLPDDYVESYTYGIGINSLPIPARDGYTFGGWYTNSTFEGNAVTTISTTDYGDKEFWAKWTANSYTITLDAQGGADGDESVSATFDSAMPSVTPPTKTGYTFDGYFDDETGGTQYYDEDGTSTHIWDKTSATILYAHWTGIQYEIMFDYSNGGEGGEDGTNATFGSAMPKLSSLPTMTGYQLLGYFDRKSGGNKYYNADGTSARNWDKASVGVLYAQWSVVKVTLSFDYGGGTELKAGTASGTYDYGTIITAPVLVKDGYYFVGWSPVFNATLTENVTYTATWDTPENKGGYFYHNYTNKQIIPLDFEQNPSDSHNDQYYLRGIVVSKNDAFKIENYYKENETQKKDYYGYDQADQGDGSAIKAGQIKTDKDGNMVIALYGENIFDIYFHFKWDSNKLWVAKIDVENVYTLKIKYSGTDALSDEYTLVQETGEGKSKTDLMTSSKIEVNAGDIIIVYCNGDIATMSAKNSSNNNCFNNNKSETEVVCSITDYIYVDTSGKTIFCHAFDINTYYMVVTSSDGEITYIKLTYNEHAIDPENFNEYLSTENIVFYDGDVITFVDTTSGDGKSHAVAFKVGEVDEHSLSVYFKGQNDGTIACETPITTGVTTRTYLKLGKNAQTNHNTVYFGNQDVENAINYAKAFNTAISLVCDANGNTNVTNLNTSWTTQYDAYTLLNDDAAKLILADISGYEAFDDLVNFAAKYDYVYVKYQESLTSSDFANRISDNLLASYAPRNANRNNIIETIEDNSALIAVILASCLLIASSAVIFVVVDKKRRLHK